MTRLAAGQRAKARLTRHPTAVEVSRILEALTSSTVDVAIFESERAYVAAASNPDATFQPRPFTDSEEQLLLGATVGHGEDGSCSVAITDAAEGAIGAITARNAATELSEAVWTGFARQLEALVGETLDEGFHEAVVRAQRDPIVVVDHDLNISWVSEALTSLLGRTPAEVIGHAATDFLHPDDVLKTLEAMGRIQQGLGLYRVMIRLLDTQDRWIPVEVTGTDASNDPSVNGVVMTLRYADYESELGASKERVERVADAVVTGLRDGIVVADEFGSVTIANSVARTMFGIEETTPVSDLSLSDFNFLDDSGRRFEFVSLQDDTERTGCVIAGPGDVRHVRTTSQPVLDAEGQPLGTVVVLHDITDEHQARQDLETQALHDQLTGLANRHQLDTRLSRLAAATPDEPVAACFIDLDNFKLVNDNHGHRIGDEVITMAAQRLAHHIRDDDLLVRLGGDEFVILLAGLANEVDVDAFANRCLQSLSDPFEIGLARFDLTASIGIALGTAESAAAGELLQQADLALYEAKKRGRNRTELFAQPLADRATAEEDARSLLRSALDEDRLVMRFQPLIDVETSVPVGYEALARIVMDDGRIIGPGEFIEAIANTGLMWELDQTAFASACEAAVLLDRVTGEGPSPYIAVNISAVSLTHPDFADTIERLLAESEVDPTLMSIEITESAAFDTGPAELAVLHRLTSTGMKLALDDFGTGYSSLAHLRDLPICSVKIDRSFIAKLEPSRNEWSIAKAVVALAEDMQLGVVAEGVETLAHVDYIQRLGFHTVQGYHYSKAMPLTTCLTAHASTAEPTDA